MKRLGTKQLILIAVAAVLVIAGVAGYLYYASKYGNKVKLELYDPPYAEYTYDWQKAASDNNIVSNYLFSRTKKLMLQDASDGVLIPTYYKIAGRLVTQVDEESGIYSLSDQALLLKCYIKAGDRSSAIALKNEVTERFRLTDGRYRAFVSEDMDEDIVTNRALIDWLDAYVEFYSVYGSTEDYEELRNMVEVVFDQDGYIKPEMLSVARYVDTLYASVDDDDSHEEDLDEASLELIYGNLSGASDSDFIPEEQQETDLEAVKLSDIDLKLIYDLELNGLLPSGSYNNALALVKGGAAGAGYPFYAYAVRKGENGWGYIYTGLETASFDVGENTRTLRNLAEMGELESFYLNELINCILNSGRLYSYYRITTGNYDGMTNYDAMTDAMEIAYLTGNLDLYTTIANSIGIRVASRASSPALYMIFREEDERYVFYASENLAVRLATS